jgi:hypothetical protein
MPWLAACLRKISFVAGFTRTPSGTVSSFGRAGTSRRMA